MANNFENGDAELESMLKNLEPVKRQEISKWNGWGYIDSGFKLLEPENVLTFTGDRYPLCNVHLPYFTTWVQQQLGAEFAAKQVRVPEPDESAFQPANVSPHLLKKLKKLDVTFSLSVSDRLFRSHGHNLQDIYDLQRGICHRIPDLVLWPGCHDDVVSIVNLAVSEGIVLIPYGGGTNVSGALSIPENETRSVASVDMSRMNGILKLDAENLTCTAESGIIGQDLEAHLNTKGFTTGHEPDSYEFSSLGGWVATRASGMKKNTYGNIEDLLIHVRMVSPTGVVEKYCAVPRMSAGPDIHHFILGSEGSLGIITQVMLKIRPLPTSKRYGSIVFPDFEAGVDCIRDIAKQRCQPSSIRLMDNEQFKFGHALRPEEGRFGFLASTLKRFYLTKIRGFDVNKMCVATLLFEGDEEDIALKEKKLYSIATKHGGLAGGEGNGERGYILTFVVAYIRDLGLDYQVVAESFETSVPWSNVYNLCENVKLVITNECRERRIKHHFVTCRVTQTYDTGACVYFYFAFKYTGLKDPVGIYNEIESIARDEILANKGSISHHHGIGKIRAKWLTETVSNAGLQAMLQIKRALDPGNIFNTGNTLCPGTESESCH